MTAHNSGKINWNVLLDNINYDDSKKKHIIKNVESLKFFSHQLLNTIIEFSKTAPKKISSKTPKHVKKSNFKTLQKKPSSNPLFTKYSDETLNLTNYVIQKYNEEHEFSLDYTLSHMLIYGNTPYVTGFIPLLIKGYIFFNLFLLGFYDNKDLTNNGFHANVLIPGDLVLEFGSGDQDLPKFYRMEFNNSIKSINQIIISTHIKNNKMSGCFCGYCRSKQEEEQKNEQKEEQKAEQEITLDKLTTEEIKDIKNFCGMIFKTLYLIYRDYPYEIEHFDTHIEKFFGFFRYC
jgi:hypothetical protein